jgi:hypothetical protein
VRGQHVDVHRRIQAFDLVYHADEPLAGLLGGGIQLPVADGVGFVRIVGARDEEANVRVAVALA